VSEKERRLRVQRILLALDASSSDASMLVAAVELAARFQAELLGLFVEDADLFRLAGESSVRAVDALLATHHNLDSRQIERLLRAQASRMRRSLMTAAERLDVSVSFRVRRGKVASEVLAEAGEADVLVLGKSGWALVRSRRISPVVRAVLSESPVPTLLLHPGRQLGFPVLVVYDGGPLSNRALDAAVDLAGRDDGRLLILVLGDGMTHAIDLQSHVEQRLEGHEIHARYNLLTKSNVPKIASIVRMGSGGTLVLPAKSSVLHDEALMGLLDEVDVPVLLVR
jgi:nucleotide-binding universal stress UspA family protein